jgi:hypothetical protein
MDVLENEYVDAGSQQTLGASSAATDAGSRVKSAAAAITIAARRAEPCPRSRIDPPS